MSFIFFIFVLVWAIRVTSCLFTGRLSDDGFEPPRDQIRMLVHYDHEEVGSDSAQGAGSSMTEDAMRRVSCGARRRRRRGRGGERSRRKSFIVSLSLHLSCVTLTGDYADVYYLAASPPMWRTRCIRIWTSTSLCATARGPGDGVVIKHNANGGTPPTRSPRGSFASWVNARASSRNSWFVPTWVAVPRSGRSCRRGRGFERVDVGAPQLSMHSVREMCGCDDVKHSVLSFTAVYEGFTKLDETLMVDGAVGNLCRPCD